MPVNWDLSGQLLSRSALDSIGPFLPSWNLHKVELFSAFISDLAEISSWKCSWKCKSLQFERKKFDTKDGRIRTQDPDGAVYYANHQTTEDLLDSGVFKYIWDQPQPKNKNLTCFETVFNPNQ